MSNYWRSVLKKEWLKVGKNVKQKKSVFLSNMFAVGVMLLCVLINQNGYYNILVAAITCLISLWSIIRVRQNIYLVIIYGIILYSNYSICAANYFSHIDTFFTSYSTDIVSTYGLNILAISSTLLFVLAPSYRSESGNIRSLVVNNCDNLIIFIGILVVLTFIWVFGFTRPDVEGARGSPSAIYEYSIIFIILGFYYAGKRKVNYVLLVIAVAMFALQNFIFGGRITGVQLIICLYLSLFVDKIPQRIVLIGFACLFILMTVIGQMRGSFSLLSMDISSALDSIKTNMFALDTAYSAYHTSLTFLLHAQNITMFARVALLGKWILSIVIGGSVTDSNLAVYTRQFYMHYYGGILPFFGYFYLSYPGIYLLYLYLSVYLKKMACLTEQSSGLIRCISVYIVTTCFRWYLYAPTQIFRGVLLLSVCYGVCYQFYRICGK